MRYAEVLLSYLEAVNESQPNAVDQNLLDLTINDIRDRVKLVGIKKTDDPQARNYRGSGATASPVDENMYYQFEKRTWAPHNRYFPIPQNDLNVNKNLKQNEGYN